MSNLAFDYEKEENENVQEMHAQRLEEARGGSKIDTKKELDSVKNLAKTATPLGALSLAKQIDFLGDMPYVAAVGAALLKDALDSVFNLVLIGGLLSILCSIFIFMMMFLVDAGKKKKMANGLMKKGLALVAGGIADSFPGLGFLPIETLTVGIIYVMTLLERKNSGESE